MTVKQIFRDFSGWTSAHGIPHIGSAQNICLRIFWAIVFLASTGLFAWQMWLLVTKYIRYDVTVQTELKFEERDFPAVTVCNLNPYKQSTVGGTPIGDLMAQYEAALKAQTAQTSTQADPNATTPGDYKLNSQKDPVSIHARANDIMLYLAAKLPNDTRRKIVYPKDEFIKNCAYNTKPCEIATAFQEYPDPVFGMCYVFNNENPPKYKSTRAGPLYGLRMLVTTNQSEYLYLTESAGVRVTIDGQQEQPFPDAFGYNAAAGFTTSFGIKFIKTERMSAPYGNCTNSYKKADYYYDGPYSTEGCFRSCFQRRIIATCNCGDPHYKLPPGGVGYCDWTKMDCVNNITASKDANFDPVKDCACPQPCNESTYGVTVSTALWPSEVYTPPDCKDGALLWNGNKTECSKWYSENTMLIEVYYERMNYQLLSESEAYALVNLISDMGGQLGLWMGFSVITVIEFFALFALLLLYCCAKPQPHPPQTQQDRVYPINDPNKAQMSHFNNSPHPPPPPYSETPAGQNMDGPRHRGGF